jgi:hypothetical protein
MRTPRWSTLFATFRGRPRRGIQALVLGGAVAALSAPSAAAYPNRADPAVAHQGSGAAVVRVIAPAGFDWGDAAIGAAGGLAISVAVAGTALAVSRRGTDQFSA